MTNVSNICIQLNIKGAGVSAEVNNGLLGRQLATNIRASYRAAAMCIYLSITIKRYF